MIIRNGSTSAIKIAQLPKECAFFKNCIRHSSSSFLSTKEEPRAAPVFPKWIIFSLLNPMRPSLNRINVWRYRRSYDSGFKPPEFMEFARRQYFQLANAVASEDLASVKSIMTTEAFDELYTVMVKNRKSEKEAWRQCLTLFPEEHEAETEKVVSAHFRGTRKSLLPASASETMDAAKDKKKRLFEIFSQISWYHDDMQRKDLIKMGYRGWMVERADVFRPLITSYLAFAKDVTLPESDWLITRAHFVVAFPPSRHVGYMARVAKLRARTKASTGIDPGGSRKDKLSKI